jgi:aubergine-like protein
VRVNSFELEAGDVTV